MKPVQSLILLVLLLSGLLPAAEAAADRVEVLRAINWVENPTNHTRRGSRGELGPYQFMPHTWKLHTNKSFQLAVVREHADEVAAKHYEWLRRGLERAQIDPSPYNIALAWNSGLSAVINGRVPMVTYNYAQRVTNLVETQRHQRIASAEVMPAPVRFALHPDAPRYVVTTEPLYEPVVVTEKLSPPAFRPILENRTGFAIATVASPGLAFIIP